MIRIIAPGKIYIDNGPVQMSVEARCEDRPLGKALLKADGLVNDLLNSLAGVLMLAKQPWPRLKKTGSYPKVLQIMLEAVAATGEASLTPMAAVAGAFADSVADFLVEEKATKVIVNNGGDIAIRLGEGEFVRVGIAPRVGGVGPTRSIFLDHRGKIGGVATSGLGGRSFTQGIADAASCLGPSAALADACATLVANHTYVDCPQVIRRPARELDPSSDIGQLMVTTKVKKLPKWVVQKALSQGLEITESLVKKRVIYGCVLFVSGKMSEYPAGLTRPLNA